jgi:hypothetical protein
MIDERTTALASRYVLGTVSAEERREFETALHGDERLQLLVKELRGTQGGPTAASRAGWSAPPDGPEEPVSSVARPFKTSDSLFWGPWLISTCFAALCLLLISSIRTQREKTGELAGKWEQQNRELARLQRQNAQLQKAAAEQATNYQQRIREFESNSMKGVEQLGVRTAAVTNQLDRSPARLGNWRLPGKRSPRWRTQNRLGTCCRFARCPGSRSLSPLGWLHSVRPRPRMHLPAASVRSCGVQEISGVCSLPRICDLCQLPRRINSG